MSQQPATNPALEFYNKWSDRTPYFTRTIVIAIIVEYILSFFLPIEDYLGNVPRYTIFSFEIYRLLFSSMVGNSFITMILILMSFPSMGTRLENSMGSASYLSLLGTLSLATNAVFAVICLLLYMVGTRSALFWECEGFWTILFSLITIECMQAPEAPRRMLFIPIDIPSKYMPLAMYALFCLFGGPQLSYAVAILVGYAQVQGYFDRYRPTSVFLEELEAADGSLHGVRQAKGYVPAGASSGHDAWIPVNAEASWAGANDAGAQGQAQGQVAQPPLGRTAVSTTQPKEMFPGQGHRLSSGGAGAGSAASSSLLGSFASSVHGAVQGSSSSSAGLSREEIAARRVAALSSSSAYGGEGAGSKV